jgi:hypothetical protein
MKLNYNDALLDDNKILDGWLRFGI